MGNYFGTLANAGIPKATSTAPKSNSSFNQILFQMKKFTLIISAICLFVLSGNAQTRTRFVDNFDMTGGVKVASTPKPIVAAAPVQTSKKLVKKTVQQQNVMKMQDAVSLKNSFMPSTGRISMSANSSLGKYTTGDEDVDSYIVDSSIRYGIDPLLIYAQMHQESSFKRKATSYKGASGLMQLMPATARRFGVTQIYDPKQNIEAGIKYMRWLMNTFNGDVALALAGYNAGEGAVMKYGNSIPPYRETQEYVRRISARYASIKDPRFVQQAKKVSNSEVARLEKKDSAPLTVYEPSAFTVRMADGRVRLVNQ